MSLLFMVFFFRKKTAYELRISVWSSDVCSSDLAGDVDRRRGLRKLAVRCGERRLGGDELAVDLVDLGAHRIDALRRRSGAAAQEADVRRLERRAPRLRSEARRDGNECVRNSSYSGSQQYTTKRATLMESK